MLVVNCSYRLKVKDTLYERIYIGREMIGGEEYIRVAKLNGNLAPSLLFSDITEIDRISLKKISVVKNKKRK